MTGVMALTVVDYACECHGTCNRPRCALLHRIHTRLNRDGTCIRLQVPRACVGHSRVSGVIHLFGDGPDTSKGIAGGKRARDATWAGVRRVLMIAATITPHRHKLTAEEAILGSSPEPKQVHQGVQQTMNAVGRGFV